MLTHLYRVKDRHDRAVDHLNNSDKYNWRKWSVVGGIVVLLYLIVASFT